MTPDEENERVNAAAFADDCGCCPSFEKRFELTSSAALPGTIKQIRVCRRCDAPAGARPTWASRVGGVAQ